MEIIHEGTKFGVGLNTQLVSFSTLSIFGLVLHENASKRPLGRDL